MAYSTVADVEDILSVEGVEYRIDDNENGNISTDDTAHVLKAINYADFIIQFRMKLKYFDATLASSDFITFCSAWIAAKWLCRRRGQSVPSSILDGVDEIMEMLNMIKDGHAAIPGVPPDTNSGISSVIVGTMRMGHDQPFRKDPYISTAQETTANNKFIDWRERRIN